MANVCQVLILSVVVAIYRQIGIANAVREVGVCYGMLGDNLPAPADVVNLYKKNQIGRMRLFDPNPDALNALRGTEILVTLGTRNEDITTIASSPDAAKSWFATNVQPYVNNVKIQRITVGNEVIPGEFANSVLPAMQNLQAVVQSSQLQGIQITPVLSAGVLASSYPPSNGAFKDELSSVMGDILKFLSQTKSPLLVNLYPYFAYAAEPEHISIEYAQFTATSPVLVDGNLSYYSLYDAMVDAFFWAMEKVGGGDVDLVVSETGWPSAGNGNFTTPDLASTYNKNLIQHVMKGSPKKPDAKIEIFIFAMFNENQKPAGVEQNWGLFYPNMQPVYPGI